MIQLDHACVRYTPEGCETIFADGSSYGAFPHSTAHYAVISHRLGYGDDLLAFSREHEIVHSIVGEVFYSGPSPVLWELAHGREPDNGAAAVEEAMVQVVQRFLRANERPIIGGVDWDAVKRRCVSVLGDGERTHG